MGITENTNIGSSISLRKIRLLRQVNNLTQERVASELGMSQSNYSLLEHGKGDIDGERLSKLAKLFHVDVVDLLADDTNVVQNVYANDGNVFHSEVVHLGMESSERQLYHQLFTEMRRTIEKLSLMLETLAAQFGSTAAKK